jgi:hypothetical protein
MCRCIYECTHLSVCLSVYLSIYPSIHPSIHPSRLQLVRPSVLNSVLGSTVGRMLGGRWIVKDVEGSDFCLVWSAVLVFCLEKMRITSVRLVDVPAEFWTGHLPNTSRKLYSFGRSLSVWHLFIFLAGWSRQAERPDIGRNFRSAIVAVHEIEPEWGSVLPNQQETIDKSCHIWVHMNVTSTWLLNLMRCPHTDILLAALARGFCKPTRLVFI